MPDGTRRDVSIGMLTVVRLLQNPLGQEAPPGERGDMVRVSDGRARVYLLPSEFDSASPATLRWMLAQRSSGTRARRPLGTDPPGTTAPGATGSG